MDRRRFLQASATMGVLSLAGCLGSGSGGDATTRSTESDPTTGTGGDDETTGDPSLPDGVYVQPFFEGMAMQGTATAGGYTAGLMYAVPHVFFTVTGTQREEVPRSGAVHLMAVVWDDETGTVLPEAGVTVELLRDGDLVSQEVIYPMLSQRMGFHWGGNFELDGDGKYVGRVSVSGLNVRRTGAFEGAFTDPATIEIPLVFNEEQRSKVTSRPIDEYGQRGALKPMEMGTMPQAFAPEKDALPGKFLAETRVDDAVFYTTLVSGDAATRFDATEYLAVSARTRYNGIVLPAMAVRATVTREDETVYEGTLERTLDPDLYYHYGAAVDGLRSGDEVTVRVTTPPQVARHEGYERAFLQMDEPMTFRV
jgi:hypothetical protein